ncbi:hypothetical protein RDABS01_039931 [Bienertia sinuspersici]
MSGSGSGSSDNEPSPKKLKFQDPITDQQAHLEAIEEAALKAIIWDCCSSILELCKKLSDQLYHSLLDAAAMLAYLLFDKEKPVYEACKWIVHKKVDQDRYSLLNEYDLATLLSRYENYPDMEPYGDDYYDYDIEFVESAIGDDIQEAIKKAKFCPRLTVDQYTSLLIGMVRNESDECQDSVLAKALEKIDIKALDGLDDSSIEDLYGLHIDDSSCSVHKMFYQHIELHLTRILRRKTWMVQWEAICSVMPFFLLFNIQFLKGPSSLGECDRSKIVEYRRRVEKSHSSVDLVDLIKVAELRRKAEGSRFIKRDHFLWAFDEIRCGDAAGLHTAFKDEIASRMVAEDHPPYHIYETALVLAQAEQESLQAEHLAFAVIFGNFFGYSEDEVKEMQVDFHSFKTALHMRGVSFQGKDLKTDLSIDFCD